MEENEFHELPPRQFCVFGLSDIEELKMILLDIAVQEITYVNGTGMIIATFNSKHTIVEIEDILNGEGISYVIFEMTPGFYSANIIGNDIQEKLFGGPINNRDLFDKYTEMAENVMQFMSPEDLEKGMIFEVDGTTKPKMKPFKIEDPTLDELLEKINEEGIDSLSKYEKDLLNRYSEEM
jgi:hypothetical protein